MYYVITISGHLWILGLDPALSSERPKIKPGTKTWDKAILAVNMFLTPVLFAVTGLDAGRFGWSSVPILFRLLAILGFIPSFGLALWAAKANTFLTGLVRIQSERGHHTVTTGPYRYIRHPMYAGMIFFDLSFPLLFGSWWGLTVGGMMILLFVIRTAMEDATPQNELPGYADYSREVRFRLFPGIW